MLGLSSSKLRQAHCSTLLHFSRFNDVNYLVRFRRNLYFQRSGKVFSQTLQTGSPNHEGLPLLLYQWQEGIEDLENYHPGGYHPAHIIGDRYHNSRYEIIHKLGFGSYSTVWLAKDHLKSRFVALKIVVAKAPES